MKREIAAVVLFLKRLLRKAEKLDPDKVERFVERLAVGLQEKFRGHWYPDAPTRGQAFRCIRVNGFQGQDPELLRACQESGLQYPDLGLPRELTLWVDPGEVCCRYGEQNPCFSVANFTDAEENGGAVTRKVASALERVTSDYHSGSSSSSSDEDCSLRDSSARPPPGGTTTQQALNPAALTWHPKKRMPAGGGKGHLPPRPHPGFRPRGRPPPPPYHHLRPLHHHPQHHQAWGPPGYRTGPGFYPATHCYT